MGDAVFTMMNYVWAGLIIISVVCAFCTGRISEVSAAALSGAGEAVSLSIVLLGSLCLWNGMMKIADRSGLTNIFARILRPLLHVLFPRIDPKGASAKAISMNMAANMLGLGSAATPLGLTAMRELDKENKEKGVATSSMIAFVTLNTASIQLIPTTVAILRANLGSKSPFDIVPPVWLASAITVTIVVVLVKIFRKVWKDQS